MPIRISATAGTSVAAGGNAGAVGGNAVAGSYQRGDNDLAVRVWRDVTEHSGVDDKVLAAECEMSRPYYSKVASGQQGDLLALAFRVGRTRPELRREFLQRLAEHEGVDPASAAAEQIVLAALRFLRLQGIRVEPEKRRMVKASL